MHASGSFASYRNPSAEIINNAEKFVDRRNRKYYLVTAGDIFDMLFISIPITGTNALAAALESPVDDPVALVTDYGTQVFFVELPWLHGRSGSRVYLPNPVADEGNALLLKHLRTERIFKVVYGHFINRSGPGRSAYMVANSVQNIDPILAAF